jgi:hypothetical protein
VTHKLQWLNCFWLLIPAFVWNIALASRLAQAGSATDAGVPQPVLAAEWALRIAVLAWPLFLPLRWDRQPGRTGLVVYCLGMLVYFASWLPLIFLPESNWSESAAGLLAPAYTPLIWLSGIALVGGSWPYAGLSVLFVVVHVYHNILAYGLITAL